MKKPKWLIYLEYIPLRIIIFIVHLIPYSLSLAIGRTIGRLVYLLIPNLKKTALNGLQIAFGQSKSQEEIQTILKQNFLYMGMFIFEFINIPKLIKNNRILNLVDFDEEALGHLRDAKESGTGSIWMLGHFGNWELMGVASCIHGFKPVYIYRPLDNPKLDEIVLKYRTIKGAKVIPKDRAMKDGKTALANNEILCFVYDQDTIEKGVFVPFFNKLAATVRGPAIFAYKSKAPVYMVFPVRRPNNTYKTVIKPVPIDYSIEDRDRFVEENTALFNRMLQEEIEKTPHAYWWVHPRWKTRPPWEEK